MFCCWEVFWWLVWCVFVVCICCGRSWVVVDRLELCCCGCGVVFCFVVFVLGWCWSCLVGVWMVCRSCWWWGWWGWWLWWLICCVCLVLCVVCWSCVLGFCVCWWFVGWNMWGFVWVDWDSVGNWWYCVVDCCVVCSWCCFRMRSCCWMVFVRFWIVVWWVGWWFVCGRLCSLFVFWMIVWLGWLCWVGWVWFVSVFGVFVG